MGRTIFFKHIHCPLAERTCKMKFINMRIIGESSLAPGTSQKPAVTFEQGDLETSYGLITVCVTMKKGRHWDH